MLFVSLMLPPFSYSSFNDWFKVIFLKGGILKGIFMFTVCNLAYCFSRMNKNIRIHLPSEIDG